MKQLDVVLWDWNGTLLDDVQVCVDCLNRLMREFGYPQQYDLAGYREVFGFPIQEYYARAGFDFSKDSFETLAARYMELYLPAAERCGLVPGAKQALAAFRAQGIRQVILSASPIETLRRQVAERGLTGSFSELLGLSDIYAKSKVQLGLSWMQKAGIAPENAVMLGDSVHDAEVAAALGVRCILSAAGHQTRAALESTGCPVADTPAGFPALAAQG
ncbi:MAG: HAD family hydrolase [Faecalibacterium sp.]|jgi:phosphoglycolate phosphatase|nr:HAD family hydrolase [Faecalibacterium sp.]